MQTKHTDKPMINIELIPDVKFCTESDHPSHPSYHPGSDLKLPQLDGTFSTIHGLDLSQHLLQLASNLHHTDHSDFNRCESIISFSDSNFEHDDDEDDDDVRSDDEDDNNSNDTNNKKEHPADNDQFYISSPASSTQSQPQTPQTTSAAMQMAQTSTCSNDVKKRSRTSVSRLQVNILRQVFKDVKNPTMKNCFSIGKEIGLTKRVIQVTLLNEHICQMCASLLKKTYDIYLRVDRKYRKMLQNYSIFDYLLLLYSLMCLSRVTFI